METKAGNKSGLIGFFMIMGALLIMASAILLFSKLLPREILMPIIIIGAAMELAGIICHAIEMKLKHKHEGR